MNRRNFIQLSLLGAGASFAAPSLVSANSTPLAAGAIYYTAQNTGRWQGKEATHLPNISVEKTGEKAVIKIITAHEMKAYAHYIVKHVLLDKNYQFVAEKMFDPTKDSLASSEFSLENYSGVIYALSMCNKHDVWLAQATV